MILILIMARIGLSDWMFVGGILIQTHDCSNANNKMWTHFNECLYTNPTLIIVFVYHWNLGEAW